MTDAIAFPTDLYVDGRFVPALSGRRFTTSNPATGEVLAEVAEAGPEDLDRAVAAARRAVESGPWKEMTPRQRGKVLLRAADLLASRADAFGAVETRDNGKPIFESARIDMPAAAEALAYFGGWADKIAGKTLPSRSDAFLFTWHEPIGVVGAITPWNFPLLQAMWKIAPALACGNAVVLKPASLTPLTALMFAALLEEAGLPPGAFNVVPGPGERIGGAMAEHAGIDKITFTGETETGKKILRAAAGTVKRVSMELGGKSPNIVFADADLDAAARGAFNGIFYGKGEVCAAGSRLLVEESAHDALLDRIVERARKTEPGDPLNPKTRLGALVSERQRETVAGYVEGAVPDTIDTSCSADGPPRRTTIGGWALIGPPRGRPLPPRGRARRPAASRSRRRPSRRGIRPRSRARRRSRAPLRPPPRRSARGRPRRCPSGR